MYELHDGNLTSATPPAAGGGKIAPAAAVAKKLP